MMKLKKPKFWDYKKPNLLSNLLFPISKIYELVLKLRSQNKNKLENIKTICVGNIYIGGTGKTSFAIELMKIFNKEKIKACFIKKYHSDQLDEQKLLEKYGKTFVDRNRIESLKKATKENFKVAIFDDGLQDKSVYYNTTFVCFNEKNIFGNGRIIPAGPLRESLDNLYKYKNIVINGNHKDDLSIKSFLPKDYEKLNFYCSTYQPNNLNDFNLGDSYLVFSGIGNHDTFLKMLLLNKFRIVKDLEYPDHYNYSDKDMYKIINLAESYNAKILTTEKDYLRLNESFKKNINYIQVELKINKFNEVKKKLINLYEDI